MSIVRMVTLAAERKEETEKVRATAAAAGTELRRDWRYGENSSLHPVEGNRDLC